MTNHDHTNPNHETHDMDCQDVMAVLSGLLDDEVPGDIRHSAERHMAGCGNCATRLNEAESLDAMVLAAAEDAYTELPQGFMDAVFNETTRAQPAPVLRPIHRIMAYSGWFAAAAAVTFAAFIWTGNQNATEYDPIEIAGDIINPGPTSGMTSGDTRSATRSAFSGSYRLGPEVISVTYDGGLPDNFSNDPGRFTDTEFHSVSFDDPTPVHPLGSVGDRQIMDAIQRDAGARQAVSIPGDRPAATIRTSLNQADQELLDQLTSVLEMLVNADDTTFQPIEQARRIAEYDNLLGRLGGLRERLSPTERYTIFAAESILSKIVHGPLDIGEVRDLRNAIRTLNLVGQLDLLTGRWNRSNAL